MPDFKFEPRVWESSTTTGVGNLALAGAATNESSLRTFSSAGYGAITVRCLYFIRNVSTSVTEWEIGQGYAVPGFLVRSKVFRSSNADAKVTFTAGLKDIMVIPWPGFADTHTTTIDMTLDFTHERVMVDSASTRTITLPLSADYIGKRYTINRHGTGSVIVAVSGSNVLHDPVSSSSMSSMTILRQFGSISVYADGDTGWVVEYNSDSFYNALSPLVTTDVAITGTVSLTSAAFGKMHLISGTGSNYTITLPAASGNAGKFIGFRVAPVASANKIYTLDPSGTEKIGEMSTLILWALETVTLLCDGNQWHIVGGRSIPMDCTLRRETTHPISYNTWTHIPTIVKVNDNTDSLTVPFGNLTNGRAEVIRPGKYIASGFASISGVVAGREFNGGVGKNNAAPQDDPNCFGTVSVPASTNAQMGGTTKFNCVAGDWIGAICFHDDNTGTGIRNTRAVSSVYPCLVVTEQPLW